MTEEYPHLVFLSENHIDTEKLPRLLQKRIRGFEELYEDLPHTTSEDRPDLVNRLNTLSLEIEEDLEEHFEDRLQQDTDDDSQGLLPAQPEEVPVSQPQEQIPDAIIPEPPAAPEPLREVIPEPIPETPLSDADILASLWKEGFRHIVPGTVAAKRLKTPLSERKLFIGNFCLQRRKYSACYDITLTGE